MKKYLGGLSLSVLCFSVPVQVNANCDGFAEQGITCFENGKTADANEVNANFKALLDKIAELENQLSQQPPNDGNDDTAFPTPTPGTSETSTGMASYIRWGRNSCPPGADLIYKGFAASGQYESGGISSALCLTDDPKFGGYFDDGNQNGAILHGTEYRTKSYGIESLKEFHNLNVPCVACLKQASLTIMIPGTNQCPVDWYHEYEGYLMGPNYKHSRGEAVCVDINPKATVSSSGQENGNLWYPTEAHCNGALACPPYVHDRELSCVVCSK